MLYHLDFSNAISDEVINKLAEVDSQSHNLIQQVQEVFADFQTVNKGLFNLDIP